MRYMTILITLLAPSLAIAQQANTSQAVLEALYQRYQRADAEAIQLQAQVSELKKQLDEVKKTAVPKEPEKK